MSACTAIKNHVSVAFSSVQFIACPRSNSSACLSMRTVISAHHCQCPHQCVPLRIYPHIPATPDVPAAETWGCCGRNPLPRGTTSCPRRWSGCTASPGEPGASALPAVRRWPAAQGRNAPMAGAGSVSLWRSPALHTHTHTHTQPTGQSGGQTTGPSSLESMEPWIKQFWVHLLVARLQQVFEPWNIVYVTLPPEMSRTDTRSQYRQRCFSICRSKTLIFGFHQNWVLQAFFCSKTLLLMVKADVLWVLGILNCICCNTAAC